MEDRRKELGKWVKEEVGKGKCEKEEKRERDK